MFPGDPMKRIHWPSTAHRGRFHGQGIRTGSTSRHLVVFGCPEEKSRLACQNKRMSFSEDGWWLRRPNVSLPRDSFEYVISAAASLARYFLLDRRAVGLACAAGMTTVVPAERGERQVNQNHGNAGVPPSQMGKCRCSDWSPCEQNCYPSGRASS